MTTSSPPTTREPIGEGLTDAVYHAVLESLEKSPDEVPAQLAGLHASDIADLIERLPGDRRPDILSALSEDRVGDVLAELSGEVQENLLKQIAPEEVQQVLEHLESDDVADVFQHMEEEQAEETRDRLPEDTQELLIYPEDSAGGLMQLETVALPGDWDVGEVLEFLRSDDDTLPEHVHSVYIVGYKKKLLGGVSLSRLARLPLDARLSDIMREDVATVTADTDQEEVIRLFEKYDLLTLPVVDDNRRLLGVIEIDDVIDAIFEEQERKFMRAAGIQAGADLFAPVSHTMKKRLPWLFVNLLTAVLASLVIALFEGQIDKLVALAILMPIVASMGGNAGTQTLTVTVRGLAMKQLTPKNALIVLRKEILAGGFSGALLASFVAIGTWLVYDNGMLGAVIFAAIILNHLFAAFAGYLIPLALEKTGRDPAISSGVFVTTVTDVAGFFAFLGLAAAVLL